MATKKTPTKPKATYSTPGTLVLQWLTYAFWGWTALALIWLTFLGVSYFIAPDSRRYDEGTVAYSLAAVLVLFAISVICDVLYTRREPLQKAGASMVIMIIHAVIFALFGIGALIAAVFAVVNMLINGIGDGAKIALLTGLIIAVVYAGTLLRTLNPLKRGLTSRAYWIFMALVVAGVTAMGIIGPAAYERSTRDDRLIERALPQLSEVINNHTAKSGELPKNLSEVRGTVGDEGRQLIDRNLVEYKTKGKVEPNAADAILDPSRSVPANAPVYAYELCVTYKAEKNSPYPAYAPESPSVSVDTTYHEAGRVCYNLQTWYGYGQKYF
jgi:hypothetical protein